MPKPSRTHATAQPVTDDLLRTFTGYAIRRAYMTVESTVNSVLRDHDLRLTAFSALAIIIENPRLTQTALAASLQIERSSTVIVVDTLENRELITRNKVAADRRTYALVATLRGQRLFDQIAAQIKSRENRLMAALDSTRHAELIQYLRSIEEGGTPLGPSG